MHQLFVRLLTLGGGGGGGCHQAMACPAPHFQTRAMQDAVVSLPLFFLAMEGVSVSGYKNMGASKSRHRWGGGGDQDKRRQGMEAHIWGGGGLGQKAAGDGGICHMQKYLVFPQIVASWKIPPPPPCVTKQ